MNSLNTLTLIKAIALLKKKQISHEELYGAIAQAMKKDNKNLNIYLSENQNALTEAKAKLETPLAGAPLAVKDNFLTVGLPTTASSQVLSGFMSPYESTVTGRLKAAGGVVIGKTNMDAWAHGSSTETSDFGPTKNPLNPDFLPGGSSGGSAAAVAANMCLGAIGSETAGSTRQPAAWCGVVGVKPTYGRVSRAGVVAMGSSLDCPGPLGKTVADCALLLEQIAGKDRYDGTTADLPVLSCHKFLLGGVKDYRIGIIYLDHPKLKGTVVDQKVHDAARVLERLGAKVDEVPMSYVLKPGQVLLPDYAIGVYTVVQRSEVSSNLARYDGIRYGSGRESFGDEAKRRIMLGTFTLSKGYAEKYYVRAQQVRSLYIKNFYQLFETYDLLISTPSPGFSLPLGASAGDPMFGELQDMLLEPSSLAGLPGISVPCYFDPEKNLSIGLNIMAGQWQEEKIFRAAYAYEQATKWNPWTKGINL
jgi:aspartyl-tRNA(Asn)/glutamyl-tRNA(Gln) amidotransferase subunit A